jgi:hypothetical protein
MNRLGKNLFSTASPYSSSRPSEVTRPLSSSIKSSRARNTKRNSNRRQSMATFMAIAIVFYIAGGPAKIAGYTIAFFKTLLGHQLPEVTLSNTVSSVLLDIIQMLKSTVKTKSMTETLIIAPTLAHFNSSYFGILDTHINEDVFDCLSNERILTNFDTTQNSLKNGITLVLVSSVSDIKRTSYLFVSLQQVITKNMKDNSNFQFSDLIIICPEIEMIVFETMFSSILQDVNVRVLKEEALLKGGQIRLTQAHSRATESVFNLIISRYITTEFYLLLDKEISTLSDYLNHDRDLFIEQNGRVQALFDPLDLVNHKVYPVWTEAEKFLNAHNCKGSIDKEAWDVTIPSLLSRTLAAKTVCRLLSFYGDEDHGWIYSLYKVILEKIDKDRVISKDVIRLSKFELALYLVTAQCDDASFSKFHVARY